MGGFFLYIVYMKKTVFAGLLTALVFSSCAQVKCSINKAYAYFTVSMPGTQMVDEKGNRVPPVPQVERVIYIEGRGLNKPVVESVSYNNEKFTPVLSKVEDSYVSPGKRYEDEKEITLKAKPGNTLWRLELQPLSGKPQPASAYSNILIKLKTAGKICSYKVPGGESQLFTLPRY